jgi:hypothetical protein
MNFEIDPSSHFQDICNLLDIPTLQLLILMQEQNVNLLRERDIHSHGIIYDYSDNAKGNAGTGALSVDKLCRGLADAELLESDLRNNISLTENGRNFAHWLTERGYKVSFWRTTVGGWGTPPEGWPDYQALLRQRAERLSSTASRAPNVVSMPPLTGAPQVDPNVGNV